jgi:hypothetical protein
MTFDAICRTFRPSCLAAPWVLATLLSFAGVRAAAGVWRGPEGSELPFRDFTEVEEFLQTARIEKARVLTSGVTRPIKVGLVKDGIRMNAVFRHINVYRQRWDSPDGIKLSFRDSYLFECASYRIARLLGIEHVPPVVRRTLGPADFDSVTLLELFPSLEGSVQAWVEDAFTEKDRRERQFTPPSSLAWMYQHQLMWLFDNLIFNDDRNQGNILIGPDWKLWFIDATRAFRPFRVLQRTDNLVLVDRTVWRRLETVPDERFREELQGLLTDSEIGNLLARRRQLLEHFRGLIRERGERRVLYQWPVPASDRGD